MGILKSVLGITALVTFLKHFKPFVRLKPNERCVRLCFGRASRHRRNGEYPDGRRYKAGDPVVLYPGFNFLLFGVWHHSEPVSVAITNADLDIQTVVFQDRVVCEVHAEVRYRVRDVYRYVFEVDGPVGGFKNWVEVSLQHALRAKHYEQLPNLDELSKEVLQQIRKEAAVWGIQVSRFGFRSVNPSQISESLLTLSPMIGAAVKGLMEHVPLGEDGQIDWTHPFVVASLIPHLGPTAAMPTAPRSVSAPSANPDTNGNGHHGRDSALQAISSAVGAGGRAV